MNEDAFQQLMMTNDRPVVLIEGTRTLKKEDAAVLTAFAQKLAEAFPQAIFRTGNAKGSDSAFALGVAGIDPSRIEYLLPYAKHRNQMIAETSRQVALDALSDIAMQQVIDLTVQASPEYANMMAQRDRVPQLRAKSLYILRDTLKVIGAEQAGLAPATVGVFYANALDPMKGGTGHTIRVCQHQGVPLVLQNEWMSWISCG